ncbi:MAG: type I glyceraldehyde-3-phosphate dehydrogenase [bacterium]|nr:type I glyceraldehyde-3-phosphate dehydrogenase [bacterium]
MTKTRIGINGMGRIGKGILRAWVNGAFDQFDIVMFNDLIDPASLVYLLKYDSVHGRFPAEIKQEDASHISVNGKKIRLVSQPDPAQIPWKEEKVDIVLECTGRLASGPAASVHLKQGVKKVVISAPAKDPDFTVVMKVNDKDYDPKKHHVISNASCTTNCLAPVAKVLHENYKILRGLMTTIHSYTNDQKILDQYHKDLRRARGGAINQIITTTGAAKAIGLVIPELKGRLDGLAVRVPTPNVSLVDFVCEVEKETTREEINRVLKAASEGPLKGVLGYCEDPVVSTDFNGSRESSIVDALSTTVMDGRFLKVLSWYDNETGFSSRMVDLVQHLAKSL